MHPNDYQEKASRFAMYLYPDYPFLALGEETGEVLGKLAKYSRKNGTTLTRALMESGKGSELHSDLEAELGDVLWQLTACCTELKISLNDLMHSNLKKLMDRRSRDLIIGNGDKR